MPWNLRLPGLAVEDLGGGNFLVGKPGASPGRSPLFQQAITLTRLRAAFPGPEAPSISFRHGLPNLEFRQADDAAVAEAVRRALEVPQVTVLRVRVPATAGRS